ncbi:unnamed protein product, partial [Ixodes persulcatus]
MEHAVAEGDVMFGQRAERSSSHIQKRKAETSREILANAEQSLLIFRRRVVSSPRVVLTTHTTPSFSATHGRNSARPAARIAVASVWARVMPRMP